jgi:hypothetical protein
MLVSSQYDWQSSYRIVMDELGRFVAQFHNRSFGKSLRASHYLGLSLYILMLTFFIALTAQYDVQKERINSVISSINKSFPADYDLFSIKSFMTDTDLVRTPSGQIPREQVKLFLKQSFDDLSIQDKQMANGDFRLSASMTSAKFENYLSAFAQKLSEILSNNEIEEAFQLEIMLHKRSVDEELLSKLVNRLNEDEALSNHLSFTLSNKQTPKNIVLNFVFPKSSNAIDNFSDGE